jgi:uncharacterized protein (DUF362 family)
MKDRSDDKHPRVHSSTRGFRAISRRRFLKALSTWAAGLLAAACLPQKPPEPPPPTGTLTPTSTPTATPGPGPTYPPPSTPTFTPTSTPTPTPTAIPTPTPTITPTATLPSPSRSQVAIAQISTYDRAAVRQQVQSLLDGLGGLGDVIRPGDRVAIKVNLTGGAGVPPLPGVAAIDSYITHPEVVRALGELLRDAGAAQIFLVEAVYDAQSYPLWGYEEVAQALNATLIDLNVPHPYTDFVSVPVGQDWFVYEAYTMHPVLQEIDAFVSVAKMKCHWSCGITLSMKNLIGLVPVTYYRCGSDHLYRSDFHACDGDFRMRLPGAVVDLNRIRPIHLALIDGIKTVEAGEGPWIQGIAPVQPGLLVAGKNPVATDAVTAAVMGFDAATAYPSAPFLRSENHVSLAGQAGLGPHRLEDIQVVGAAIEDVRYGFRPCWG